MADATRKPRALVAFHGRENLEATSFYLEDYGYEITAVQDRKEFLRQVRVSQFEAYIWDANLGYPATLDISVSREVWPLLKERYEKGEIKVRAVSNTPETVRLAEREGIPAEDTLGMIINKVVYFKRE